MIKRILSRKSVEEAPYLIWNAFIDILANEDENDLSDRQRDAQRSFWYDSEVQNGGHLQYFENSDRSDYADVVRSLREIGAQGQATILEQASKQYLRSKTSRLNGLFNFLQKAKEGIYADYDSRYYAARPEMNAILAGYLRQNIEEFVEFTNDGA
jgi:hypothetical protein